MKYYKNSTAGSRIFLRKLTTPMSNHFRKFAVTYGRKEEALVIEIKKIKIKNIFQRSSSIPRMSSGDNAGKLVVCRSRFGLYNLITSDRRLSDQAHLTGKIHQIYWISHILWYWISVHKFYKSLKVLINVEFVHFFLE